jgi:hypothetical protein
MLRAVLIASLSFATVGAEARCAQFRGAPVSQLSVEGIVKSPRGYKAILRYVEPRYTIGNVCVCGGVKVSVFGEGETFLDGAIQKITMDSVTFRLDDHKGTFVIHLTR